MSLLDIKIVNNKFLFKNYLIVKNIIKFIYRYIMLLRSFISVNIIYLILKNNAKNKNRLDFLYIDFKYRGGIIENGISDFQVNLLKSFNEYKLSISNNIRLETYYIDYNDQGSYLRNLKYILNLIIIQNPKYIIYIPPLSFNAKYLDQYFFKYIIKKTKTKLISLNTDANGFIDTYNIMEQFRRISFLTIILDSPKLVKEIKNNNFIYLHSPLPKDYNVVTEDIKDIKVSFIGSYSKFKQEREDTMEYINLKIDDVVIAGGYDNKTISTSKYIEYLQRSQMSINFSTNSNKKYNQLKGRVYEIMLTGGLLLESNNTEIEELFVPYEDYIPFNDKYDLEEKINYYQVNKIKALNIAQNGYKKCMKNFTGILFWVKLVDKIKELEKYE